MQVNVSMVKVTNLLLVPNHYFGYGGATDTFKHFCLQIQNLLQNKLRTCWIDQIRGVKFTNHQGWPVFRIFLPSWKGIHLGSPYSQSLEKMHLVIPTSSWCTSQCMKTLPPLLSTLHDTPCLQHTLSHRITPYHRYRYTHPSPTLTDHLYPVQP